MTKYSDYNIISLGDHCALPLVLKEMGIRKASYPFDWVSKNGLLHDTNIMYNIELLNELSQTNDIDKIVKKFIGNAFQLYKKSRINTLNNIRFPHDNEDPIQVFEKYKRRFIRLKTDITKKTVFVLLMRYYFIPENIFKIIVDNLLKYNEESVVLFISGKNHEYFENFNHPNVIFKYIEYDISKFYEYDYSTFRPNIKKYLTELFL
jgi:hypothetical protein